MPADEFKLSITRALADQLADALARLTAAPLTDEQLAAVKDRPGVYELFLEGARVYVGKSNRLRQRLSQHLRKLSGRLKLSLEDVGFVCLYVDEDFEAAAPEKLLIKKYLPKGDSPWNNMGFGNKDPGKERDGSLVKANHFDALYPINLDFPVTMSRVGRQPLSAYLKELKSQLPFTFRFDSGATSRALHRETVLDVPAAEMTAREAIVAAVEALTDGWQATALPGYVILYPKTNENESAFVMWRKHAGTVVEVKGAAEKGPPGVIEEDVPA